MTFLSDCALNPFLPCNTRNYSSDRQSSIPSVNPVDPDHSAVGGAIPHVAHALAGHQINYVGIILARFGRSFHPVGPAVFFRDLLFRKSGRGAAGADAPRGSGATAGLGNLFCCGFVSELCDDEVKPRS